MKPSASTHLLMDYHDGATVAVEKGVAEGKVSHVPGFERMISGFDASRSA
jgi:hypothetical protein